jgi:nucleotide-binding universal stress UspA family protein
VPHTSTIRSIPTKILLPMDFSASSDAALESAADLADHFHAELVLLHIIPTTPDFNGSDFFPETSVLQEARADIEAKLAKRASALRSRGIKASPSIEVGNDLAGSIMRVIEQSHIDMVVISTHGMSGWRPMSFGSTAEKIIRRVQCPLLLLRAVTPISVSEDFLGAKEYSERSTPGRPCIASALDPSSTSRTQDQRRLGIIADEASERASRTENRYDQDHHIFTK